MMEPMVPVASVLSALDWRSYLEGDESYHREIDEYGKHEAEARACLRRLYELTAQVNHMLSIAAIYQVPLEIRVHGTSGWDAGFDLAILEDRDVRKDTPR